MKRKSSIAFSLVFVLLAACGQHNDSGSVETRHGTSLQPTASPALSAIDSLMWQQPDSALVLLQDYFACRDAMLASPDTVDSNLRRPDAVGSNLRRIQCVSTTFDRHYAHLLLSELLYKNDYAQTNRAELQQAVAYYDSLCRCTDVARNVSTDPAIAFLDARGHYINGVGYYERDSVVEACAEYLKALETMEGHFDEDEMVGKKAKFMALTYTHLAGLFSNLYLHEQALCFGKLSLDYYGKYDAEAWHIAWALNDIGAHYDMMEQYDNAAYYYDQALHSVSDTVSQFYRAIATRQAFLSYEREHVPDKSLAELYRLASQAENDNELVSRYLVLGDIYYYERQYDSAWVYLKWVYDNTTNADSKMLSTERLQELSLIKGDSLSAKEYALEHSQLVTVKDLDGKLHSQLTALCQHYEQNRQEAVHKLKRQQDIKRWSIVLVILLSVVVVAISLLMLSRKRNKQLQNENDDVGKLLESERQTHKIQQAALSGRLRQSNVALRDVSRQLEKTIANNVLLDVSANPDDYSSYINAPICQYLITLVHKQQFKSKMDCLIYKDFALSKEQLLALRNAAEKTLPRFTAQIRQQFPGLTDGDMDYCYLFLLGLNEADVSALMQRAYTTVCDRSRKISRTIGANGSLDHTLRNLLSER